MATFNPFASDAFSLVNMTEAINLIPNQYGKINQMGLFREIGISSTVALIERRNGSLNLIPSTQWGGPPAVNTSGKRDIVAVPVPHIPVVDVVLPSDVQGVRAFGTESQLETVANLVAQKQEDMSGKLDITLEYLRMGALKGIVVDGDGTTVLVNLFTTFGVTQQVINFQLSSSTLDVKMSVQGVSRYFEDNLNGEIMSEVLVLCSGGFWDSLTSHPNVIAAYQYWVNQNNNTNLMRDDLRMAGFVYQGVRFVEYRGKASLPGSGGTVNFVPPNEAIAIPFGTRDMFRTYFAPANFNETVNTIGLKKYSKKSEREMGQGWSLWSESNPLAITTRPDLLVKITKS